jgi:hypothetical protein
MSPSPLDSSTVNMPSENTFRHHASVAQGALKTFNAIRHLDAPGPVKTAFNELVSATAAFNNFATFFSSHPLFQEIPPLVLSTLEEFLQKHPNFETPAAYSQIVSLDARIADSRGLSAAKKGTCFTFVLHILVPLLTCLTFSFSLAVTSAASLRPEKGKKTASSTNKALVSLFSFSFTNVFLIFDSPSVLVCLRNSSIRRTT